MRSINEVHQTRKIIRYSIFVHNLVSYFMNICDFVAYFQLTSVQNSKTNQYYYEFQNYKFLNLFVVI